MLTIRVPSIKCSRFHSQETEDSIDGNDSPGGGAELCPPDFVFLALTRRNHADSRETYLGIPTGPPHLLSVHISNPAFCPKW